MSLALERLRTLRRQAGGAGAPPAVAGPAAVDPQTADVSATRNRTFDPQRDPQRNQQRDPHRDSQCDPEYDVLGDAAGICDSGDSDESGDAADAVRATASARASSVRRSAHTVEELRRLLRVRAPAPAVPASPHAPPHAPSHALPHAQASAHASARAAAPAHPPAPADRTLPGEEVAPGLHLIEHRLPWPVAPVLPLGFDPRIAQAHSADIVCFDTETTGLAGGTGTRAFMIGIAQWRDDMLHIRQWFMTRLQAERELLSAFADTLGPRSVLVSYNGRSYDAPLLRTRFRLARMHEPLTDCAHVDLLHPTRRRYRGHWENCRLATIERRVLGVVREDDLPGSEAPAAWLRYLRGGCARDLGRVAEHNRQDLASLAGLLLHLGRLADAEADPVDI